MNRPLPPSPPTSAADHVAREKAKERNALVMVAAGVAAHAIISGDSSRLAESIMPAAFDYAEAFVAEAERRLGPL